MFGRGRTFSQICQNYCRSHLFSTSIAKLYFLPPASEGWEKVIFSLCVSVHTSMGGGGVPQPGLDGGGYPSQVWMVGGVPQQGLDGGGGTSARSGWWGVPPSQVWMVGVPGQVLGTPHHPDLAGVPPPTMTGWGTPHHDWMGYPPTMTGWGTPHHDPPPPSIASTCYAAGDMPLAFTQEDFLVLKKNAF